MNGFTKKILDLEALRAAVREARAAGKTIVQCHGCFDIVHPGHIRYLEFARQQGDILVVSLTGDADISKGDTRPYIPQELRAENLAALMFVDHVYVTSEPTACAALAEVKPDVYVKGQEYENSTQPGFLQEKAVVESYGGRIIYSSGETVFSSTRLIESAGGRPIGAEFESHRLNLFCRRHEIDAASIESALKHFRDLHVLVVGDIIMDRYVICDAIDVASESPMLSLIQRDERSYVGGAAIVARHVAAMGAKTFLLSAGASDALTQTARDVFASEGIDAHLIDARQSLVEKTRYLVDDTKVLKVERATRSPLDSLAERRAAMILEQQSKVCDAVIFCDFGYGMITGGLLNRVLPTLRQNVRTLAADVSGGRGHLLHFRNVDLLCPTERELRTILHDFDSGLSTVAWNLLERTQARHLLVTLDKRGMVVFERRSQDRNSPEWSARLRSEQLPSFADRVVDRLGCGDALLAASTLALASGENLMHAAYLGNAAAAMEIALLGNHPADPSRWHNWLQSRRELRQQPAMHQFAAAVP